MAGAETVSLWLTGVFGLVSTVGVTYQIIDIRQRARNLSAGSTNRPQATAHAPIAPSPVPRPVEPSTTATATGYVVYPPPQPSQPQPWLDPRSQPQPRYPTEPAPRPAPIPQQPALRVDLQGRSTQPDAPAALQRARLLLVALSVLMVPVVIAMSYALSKTPPSGDSRSGTSLGFGAYAIVYVILSIPIVVLLAWLSHKIASGRNWARITTVVVLLALGSFCSCFGAVTPFAGYDADLPDLSAAFVVFGVLSFLFGLLGIITSVILLRNPLAAYFRDMSRWRGNVSAN